MFLSYSGFCEDMLSSKFMFAAVVLVFKNALRKTTLIIENENFRRKFVPCRQSIGLTLTIELLATRKLSRVITIYFSHYPLNLSSFRPLQKEIGTKMVLLHLRKP